MRQAIEQPIDLGEGRVVCVSAAMGVAFYPADGKTVTELMRKADEAMYLNKGHLKPAPGWLLPLAAFSGSAHRANVLALQTSQTVIFCGHRVPGWSKVAENGCGGIDLHTLRSGCCGMAGLYAHEKANRAASEAIYDMSWANATGGHRLFLSLPFCLCVPRQRRERWRDAHRMKRPAYADEVAAVIGFLCSDDARWISGVNLPVDGGLASTFI
eukprot:gene37997-46891_t